MFGWLIVSQVGPFSFASAVVEALISIGYGVIKNKRKRFTDEQKGVKTKRETPTLLSVGGRLKGDPQTVTNGFLVSPAKHVQTRQV